MKLQISIDGRMYEVEVEVAEDDYPPQMQDNHPTPVSTTIQSTVLRTPPKPGSSMDPDNHEAKLCRSPLAGIIVQVPVAEGQQLEVDDLLVVLEAMKMEIKVTAPVAGKVKSVKVAPGDAVAVNQILVDFE